MLEPQYHAYLQNYLDTLPTDAPQRRAPTDARRLEIPRSWRTSWVG